jgi:hypothetical protein
MKIFSRALVKFLVLLLMASIANPFHLKKPGTSALRSRTRRIFFPYGWQKMRAFLQNMGWMWK